MGDQSLTPLGEILRRIVDVAHPDRIILFGSSARGDARPDSDFDLLVIAPGIIHRSALTKAIHLRLRGISAAADIIVVTPEDVERYRDAVGTVIRSAMREGREVYAA